MITEILNERGILDQITHQFIIKNELCLYTYYIILLYTITYKAQNKTL